MKQKLLTAALVSSILISALIGGGAAYSYNKILQASHKTTYTLEEEIAVFDRIIEMAEKNEIQASGIIKAFTSQKKSRIAAYDVMSKSQDILYDVIAALFFVVILQLILLHSHLKMSHEN